jgi:hypothetical protein
MLLSAIFARGNRGVDHESAVAGAMNKMNQQFRFLLTSLAGIQFSGDVVLSYTLPPLDADFLLKGTS